MWHRLVTIVSLGGLVATAPATWEHVGPRNIFNDAGGHGEAGTLADAASPAANPKLIYTGGSNNGASSGILKTTDGGLHWARKSKGLMDTRISAVLVTPDDPAGGHVFAGTTTGIYESVDFAESWQFIPGSAALGRIRTLRVGRIDGTTHVIAAGAPGIGAAPLGRDIRNAKWTVAAYPPPSDPEFNFKAGSRFTTSIDPKTGDSVLGACVRIRTVGKPCTPISRASWKSASVSRSLSTEARASSKAPTSRPARSAASVNVASAVGSRARW